jgi:thioredoxin 1
MNKFDEIIQGETPVLIDFYAEWCAPCKMMPPVLKQVKDTFGDKLKIIKIDTDKNPELSQLLQIRSIPTLMLYNKGEKKWQTSGFMPANQLINSLKNYTN